MRRETMRMLAAVLIAAALFVLLFVGWHWNLIVCIFLCVGVYFGLSFLLKPSRKIGGIDVEALPDGETIQEMLEEARADLKEMDRAIRAITDASVRREAESLYAVGTRILAYLEEEPGKIKLARRFLTYYLDTAAKLLTRYVDFQDTGLHSEEVTEILRKTAEAIPVLRKAFERQFTHLMQGELMDVEADIELLKSTLKMEGGK